MISRRPHRPVRWRVRRLSVAVAVIALAVTAAGAVSARLATERSEQRLLHLKVAEAGAALQQAIQQVQTELSSAAEFAATSRTPADAFAHYIGPFVGDGQGFESASLWRLRPGSAPTLVRVVGAQPVLATRPAQAGALFARAASTAGVSVSGTLAGPDRRLGYAYTVSGPAPAYVVYTESPLPAGSHVSVPKGGPFSDLRFALYLGTHPAPGALLEANVGHVAAPHVTAVLPFGDQSLTVVAASADPLGGRLSADLWWLILVVGVALSLGAGTVTERLVRERQAAERSADALSGLLEQQRTVSARLQQAMVPAAPPPVRGVETAVRYLPGSSGLDIGGDWYDVIDLGCGRAFLSIGDVTGRGVVAGALMASLRAAVRAFVSEGHSPAAVLDRLAQLVHPMPGSRFATVLTGVLDLTAARLTLASAGHLPPLLVTEQHAGYVELTPGPPVGAFPHTRPYAERVLPLPAHGSLLLFTDGLIERPDEILDEGLRRLQDAANHEAGTINELVAHVITSLQSPDIRDDTAVLGLRW